MGVFVARSPDPGRIGIWSAPPPVAQPAVAGCPGRPGYCVRHNRLQSALLLSKPRPANQPGNTSGNLYRDRLRADQQWRHRHHALNYVCAGCELGSGKVLEFTIRTKSIKMTCGFSPAEVIFMLVCRKDHSPGPGVGAGTSRNSMPGSAWAFTTACIIDIQDNPPENSKRDSLLIVAGGGHSAGWKSARQFRKAKEKTATLTPQKASLPAPSRSLLPDIRSSPTPRPGRRCRTAYRSAHAR